MMKKGKSLVAAAALVLALLLMGCDNSGQTEGGLETGAAAGVETVPSSEAVSTAAPVGEGNEEDSEMQMNVQIGSHIFTATLEKNAAADGLSEMMKQGPVTIQMSDYSGFEKVGPLGTSLPASNRQTTTHAGDIVLYQGNQIVIFYGSNSWSYTRLGRIDDLTGWEEALGSGDVTVTFSMEG